VGADVTLAGNLALALKLHNKLDQAERVYQHLLGEACSQDFSDATPSSCLDRNASILAEYAQLLEKKGKRKAFSDVKYRGAYLLCTAGSSNYTAREAISSGPRSYFILPQRPFVSNEKPIYFSRWL